MNTILILVCGLMTVGFTQAQLIHVHSLAYGKNGCESETALAYQTSVVDASLEVSEKKRLEGILTNQIPGITRFKSSSSKFAMGNSATSVAIISWQGGTQNCPTKVISFIYGKTEDEALSKASDHFKLWAQGGASMETIELRNFLEATTSIPVIKTQPAGLTVTEGSAVTLTVSAGGSGTLSYQWRKGGVDLPQATEPELVFAKVSATDSGVYDCRIWNDHGGTISEAATLSVNHGAPDIHIEHPAGSFLVSGSAKRSFGTVRIGKTGASKTFSIRNTGTNALKNIGVAVSGPNGSDFIVTKPVASLTPGARTVFKVSFSPKSTGTRKAFIDITSNDPDEQPFRIDVVGTGASKFLEGSHDFSFIDSCSRRFPGNVKISPIVDFLEQNDS